MLRARPNGAAEIAFPPMLLLPLTGPNLISEAQRVHVTPWFHNLSAVYPHCQTTLNGAASAAEALVCTSGKTNFRLPGGTTMGCNPSEHQRTLGKFALLDLVGARAFSSVDKALDTVLGRTVAVKVQRAGNLGHSSDCERFLCEVRSVVQHRKNKSPHGDLP